MRKNETIKKEGEEMTNFSRELTAKRIKDLRIKNGYTIEQLADLIGVSKGTVSKWENGYVGTIKQSKLVILSEILHCSPLYLLGIEEEIEQDDNPDTKTHYVSNHTKEIAEQIFNNKELRLLFDAAKDASPEDLKTVHTMLTALKKKEG